MKRAGGSAKERLEASISKCRSGCWIRQTCAFSDYGSFRLDDGRVMIANRAAWTILVGEIPAGMSLNHLCSIKACLNPEHQYVGTRTENGQDRWAQGRLRAYIGDGRCVMGPEWDSGRMARLLFLNSPPPPWLVRVVANVKRTGKPHWETANVHAPYQHFLVDYGLNCIGPLAELLPEENLNRKD